MELPIGLQGRQFLWAVLLGMTCGLVYDFLRGLRRTTRGLTALSDGLFVLYVLAGNCLLLLYVGKGAYRIFFPIAITSGAALWFFTLSVPCLAIFTRFWRLLLWPFRLFGRILKKIIRKMKKFSKKGFSRRKKSGTIVLLLTKWI
jgi:hypothetical protein